MTKERTRKAAKYLYFTDDAIAKLKPKPRQYLAWDRWDEGRKRGDDPARGLAVIVYPSGSKSFRCVYRYPGDSTTHWKKLGRVGVMTLQEARDATRDAQRVASRGEDPTGNDPSKSDKFTACIDDYIKREQIGRSRNKSAGQTKQVVLSMCKDWSGRAVGSIRRKEVKDLLTAIRDGDADTKPRPYLANRLHNHLRHFFGWCVDDEKISASPMAGLKPPVQQLKGRDRAWFKKEAADDAIRAIWKAADTIGGVEGQFLKTLVLTGKRPGVNVGIGDMKWEDIKDDWFWDAPVSGVKNKRRHPVHLPKRLQRVLHPRQQQGNVFTRINFSMVQKRVRALTGMSDFIFHGVRHLVATKVAELKVPPHICDCLFDHVPVRGTGKIYNHHDYVPEMREAIELWSTYVERLVDPQGEDRKVRVLR
jgi:hypothetical protein